MRQVGGMKLYDFEEILEETFGAVGTPERDEFEKKVDEAVHASRIDETQNNIYDDSTMLDVAASIINDMLVTAIKANKPDDEIQMYHREKRALWSSDKSLSRSMLDKAINYYGPIVRARYADDGFIE